MPIIINEVIVDMHSTENITELGNYGVNAEDNIQKMITDFEIADERQKRLEVD